MKSLKSLFRRPAAVAAAPGPQKSGGGTSLREAASASSLDTASGGNKPPAAKRSKKLFAGGKAAASSKLPAQQVACSQDSLCSSDNALADELHLSRRENRKLHAKVDLLRNELSALKQEMDQKNILLQAKLQDVAHSPLSDSEKQELMQQHSAANPTPVVAPLQTGDGTASSAVASEWESKNTSSDASVACLQDRIVQMDETLQSTTEELQATLQELADLQAQLRELHGDNERLADEKRILMESLCQQTEKLEDSRGKVDTLQELLLGGQSSEGEAARLHDLLKSVQEERELLVARHEETSAQLTALRDGHAAQEAETARHRDRVALLESTVDATHCERAALDRELACAKQEASSKQIEISRLATLLENARAKIEELEAARDVGNKTAVEEVLDGVRRDKEQLEAAAAAQQEQLSRSQAQADQLRDQLHHMQEACKVLRNNNKSQVNDLEYQCSQLQKEKQDLIAELARLQETAAGLQEQCQCHLEDKRQLKSMLSERQRDLMEIERKMEEQKEELVEEKKLRLEETAEWDKFQSDLLMAVRVANDFKTEAQVELEKLVLENKTLRDKVRALDTQLDRQKALNKPAEPQAESAVLSSVQQELQVRRQKTGVSRQDSRLSVKSLIDSIENAAKLAKNGPGSRSSSTSSLSSIASGVANANTMAPQSPTSELIPLREQQNKRNILSENVLKSETKRDDDCGVSIFSNKSSIDFGRRNSQPDISERKDPLSYLAKNGGSKRNALLNWCQRKTVGYRNIDITNFSSSWNDGLAFCAILHTYLPDRVPYDTLTASEKRRNFAIAFAAAESVGVPTTLNVSDMVQLERPDWQQVIAYVTDIYRHFET